MGRVETRPELRSLKGDRAFQRLRKGRSGGTRLLAIRWRPTKRGTVRVGIVVSKKVGKAVTRNRVRRRLREALRRLLTEVRPEARTDGRPSFDLLVIARPEAAEADFWQLERALRRAMTKGNLL